MLHAACRQPPLDRMLRRNLRQLGVQRLAAAREPAVASHDHVSAVTSATPPATRPPAADSDVPRRFAALFLGAALAVPLLVYAAIGAFSRYVADDFCW